MLRCMAAISNDLSGKSEMYHLVLPVVPSVGMQIQESDGQTYTVNQVLLKTTLLRTHADFEPEPELPPSINHELSLVLSREL